jgi:hypothetical protein
MVDEPVILELINNSPLRSITIMPELVVLKNSSVCLSMVKVAIEELGMIPGQRGAFAEVA